MKRGCYGFVLALMLSACGEIDSDQLRVVDPYIRELPTGKQITAAFLTLENNSASDCQFSGASAEFAQQIEIHAHRHNQGRMRMEKLDYLTIEQGSRITFSPGGYHLMVMGVNRPLLHQETYPVMLNFLNCPDQLVDVVVKSVLDE